MLARSQPGCWSAASSTALRCVVLHHRWTDRNGSIGGIRYYLDSKQPKRLRSTASPSPPSRSSPVESHLKAALEIVESPAAHDPINAPRSTLPPRLDLPDRGDKSAVQYWYRIGRAYGTFYKNGIYAVWYNHKAVKRLKERVKQNLSPATYSVTDAVSRREISRSEFQLLARNSHDIGKLPVFGVLVLIFGEWLPLLVPFIPGAVPGTCRIPKQVRGMRMATEERRLRSFRMGVTEPDAKQVLTSRVQSSDGSQQVRKDWAVAFSPEHRNDLLRRLRDDQLFHLSSVLGLHSRLWDRVQLSPPAFLLRRVLDRHLQYVAQDDVLLLRHEDAAQQLSSDELYIACEQRGFDILGKKDAELRKTLAWWLQRQQEDKGWGSVMLTMLFRRLAMRDWVQLNVRANRSV